MARSWARRCCSRTSEKFKVILPARVKNTITHMAIRQKETDSNNNLGSYGFYIDTLKNGDPLTDVLLVFRLLLLCCCFTSTVNI